MSTQDGSLTEGGALGVSPAPEPAAIGANVDLHAIAGDCLREVSQATSPRDLDEVVARYLGRGDGLLTRHRRSIGSLSDPDARRARGQIINVVVGRVEGAVAERRSLLDEQELVAQASHEQIDVTWPYGGNGGGHLHPITRAMGIICDLFARLGYEEVVSPEVEYDLFNFTLVNMPPGHPARDTQANFVVDDDRILRSQTTPGQIRALAARGVPLRVIVPGKAYRRDWDATHFPMFHQVEGLCVDEGISVADLKGTLELMVRALFGPEREIRLRPHHFPFTEPSLEVDVTCMACDGSGCKLCKHSGWIELLGSGMVHPVVLENVGIDSSRYSGFAFGIGVDRAAQLAFGISDGRPMFENDLRFLERRK